MDRMLDALGSRPRRQLLVTLLSHNPQDEPTRVEELEFDDGDDDAIIRLHHCELPKLDHMGYISWDRESGEIATGPAFDEIRPLLEHMVADADVLPADWM